jgi:uncharacterized protein (DUF1330 family)
MPKGYLIIQEDIHDPEGMLAYSKASGASLADFGGRPLVVDDDFDVLEGSWHGNRTIILEFDDVEKAREWYESPGYQAALPLRQAAADCNGIIASGFSPAGAAAS